MALTSAEARRLFVEYGPNAIPSEPPHRFRNAARRFWGPIPWLLEMTLVLLVVGRRYGDAVAVGFLLCFNAFVAAVQEDRSRSALALLQQRIVVRTRVKRDAAWQILPAADLVPGDLLHLGAGDIVPADVQLENGLLEVDQSVLTGESAPQAVAAGAFAYAATTVTHGDATAVVTATGRRTKFGKTAELVRTAKSRGQLELLILRLVSVLGAISVAVIAAIALTAWRAGSSATDTIAFAVMILLASVPIALPAAFTIATTIGSLELSKRGALVTRLSALEDVASMDVLCADKTGTITQNRIAVDACTAFPPFTPGEVAAFAAAASDESTGDPIDLAVLAYAHSAAAAKLQRDSFGAFDPSRKYSVAQVHWNTGLAQVYKGAPAELGALAHGKPPQFESQLERMAGGGSRVLAVAVTHNGVSALAGLLALADAPRNDARALISRLRSLGIDVLMLTGDTRATALAIAARVGIAPDAVRASVYPEDKLNIVKTLQRTHAVVGMTGDGVNDAPALRQATVGIAVSTATDVAKAASGIVLTQPGLANIVAAVESGRAIFERMVTYTMMKLVKYFEVIGVLSVAFFVTKRFLMTPELLVALLVLNDFVTLSVATDNVGVSKTLDVWNIRRLISAALPISVGTALAVSAGLLLAAFVWHVTQSQMQSVAFFSIAAMGQIALYVLRSRSTVTGPAPSALLLASSCGAVLCAGAIVLTGIFSAPIPPLLGAALLGVLTVAGALLTLAKALVLRTRSGGGRSRTSHLARVA